MIYLDNNATTQIDPEVLRTMSDCWHRGALNPSSQHAGGRLARTLLDQSRIEIAKLLGADIASTGGEQLLITSGGTEANAWALTHLLAPQGETSSGQLWISAVEHPSVLETARQLGQTRSVQFIPVDRGGRVRLNRLADMLDQSQPPAAQPQPPAAQPKPARMVSVIAANNETGVLQDLAAIGRLCRERGVLFHTDATQWVGKLPLDFRALEIDAMTFTAHKFHGPIGVGGLLLAPQVRISPLFLGGQQQLGLRAGTEPVPLVVGMAVALRMAASGIDDSSAHIAKLRDTLEFRLADALPAIEFHGRDRAGTRLTGTSCVSFSGVDRQALLMRLDRAGIACSTGSACTSGSSEPSHVLRAMGVSGAAVESALRFGVSRFSTAEEIDLASERIIQAVNKLRLGVRVEKVV